MAASAADKPTPSVCLCIPTRGKPDSLGRFTARSLDQSSEPTTRFVIAIDEDDEYKDEAIASLPKSEKIIISVRPREDSVGGKYNRCVRECGASIYLMGTDDIAIGTPGWDRILLETATLFTDGIGAIHFGVEPHGEYQPSIIAWTKGLIDVVGQFCPELFPFWWHNSWDYEIAEMAGRIVPVDIVTEYPEVFDKSQRRDIQHWAEVFDRTRPEREAAADRVLAAIDNAPWHTWLLRQARQQILDVQLQRNAPLRDPAFVAAIEQYASSPAPLDERHQRLRAKAGELVAAQPATPDRHVLIAIVAYDSTVDVGLLESLLSTVFPLAASGWRFGCLIRHAEADLGRTRNGILAECYAGGYSDLLCLDADVFWDGNAVMKLLSHPVDFVVGAYKRRDGSDKFSLRPLADRPLAVGANGLVEVEAAPLGFARITRKAIEHLIQSYPDRWYNDECVSSGRAPSLVEFGVRGHERISEDYNLCDLWRKTGGHVWIDPTLRLSHAGRAVFSGSLVDRMKENALAAKKSC